MSNRSSSPSKSVKFSYDSFANNVTFSPENNIYNVDVDYLRKLLGTYQADGFVHGFIEELSVSNYQWADVASSSDDDDFVVVPSSRLKAIKSSDQNESSSQKEKNADQQASSSENLEAVGSGPSASKSAIKISALELVRQKSRQIFESISSEKNVDQQASSSENLEAVGSGPSASKSGSRKLAVRGELHRQSSEIKSSELQELLRGSFSKAKNLSDKQSSSSKSADCAAVDQEPTLHGRTQKSQSKKNFKSKKWKKAICSSENVNDLLNQSKSVNSDQNNEVLNRSDCESLGGNHINKTSRHTFMKTGKKEFKKNQFKTDSKFKNKRSSMAPRFQKKNCEYRTNPNNTYGEPYSNSFDCSKKLESIRLHQKQRLSEIMHVILKKVSEKKLLKELESIVHAYCTVCDMFEANHFNYLNNHVRIHQVGSRSASANLMSNFFCPSCKLIICCHKDDDYHVIRHRSSIEHKIIEKAVAKKSPSSPNHQQLSEVDLLVVGNFQCDLFPDSLNPDSRCPLVPYGNSDESDSNDSNNEDTLTSQLTDFSKLSVTHNLLANVWVFPFKMTSDEKDNQNWVKFIGTSDHGTFKDSFDTLLSTATEEYGRVEKWVTDVPSKAAYVLFGKRKAVIKLSKVGPEFREKHDMYPVKLELDLLGRGPGSSGAHCSALLGNKRYFVEMIDKAVAFITKERESYEEKSKLISLKMSIKMAIEFDYPNCEVYEFGSRISGLATSTSDYDIYIDLSGKDYWGTPQSYNEDQIKAETIEHITRIQKILKGKRDEFNKILPIITARVPILRFTHIPSDSNCDVSFKDGLCVENTKLISKYLSMNPKIRWVIVAVKHWAQICGILSSTNFTTYALTWMVLFYLMTKRLIPSVGSVMNLKKEGQPLIRVWKYETIEDFGVKEIEETKEVLLQGFYGYFAHFNFKDSIMCPRAGRTVPKNIIEQCIKAKIPEEIKEYVDYLNTFNPHERTEFEITDCCIQDPFLLTHNLTKQVRPVILKDFRKYCDLANIEILLWGK